MKKLIYNICSHRSSVSNIMRCLGMASWISLIIVRLWNLSCARVTLSVLQSTKACVGYNQDSLSSQRCARMQTIRKEKF